MVQVFLAEGEDFDAVFMVQHIDPSQRLRTEYQNVPAHTPVVITHCATFTNLCVTEEVGAPPRLVEALLVLVLRYAVA
eukprot:scaffold973_cov399-Prasinococcus_capsulatus_cf.AAC.9